MLCSQQCQADQAVLSVVLCRDLSQDGQRSGGARKVKSQKNEGEIKFA
jgi:hypothetical protein